MMEVVLVNPRGFCAGVRMAIDVVDQLLDIFPPDEPDSPPIYVYHEIVHNSHVVGRFVDRGVRFVESLDEVDVPRGDGDLSPIIVFSAHGIPPSLRVEAEKKGLRWVDATCPLVTKVHAEAIRFARKDYQILLIGHEDHQEVVGTRGEAPEHTIVVESVEQAKTVAVKDPSKLIYLTQTTLSTDDAETIISALKERFPEMTAPKSETICYATTNRQQAVRELAPDADLTLVVGSQNSSNSVRLTEISQNAGCAARLVDDVSEIDWEWFADAQGKPFRVVVTAGASAPEDLVAEIVRAITERFDANILVADIMAESIEFGMPLTLRKLLKERGFDLGNRRIRVRPPEITPEVYGAEPVPLTLEGSNR